MIVPIQNPVPANDSGERGQEGEAGPPRLRKAAGAFRTISEVADELHIPQHVLRFWETRFPQVKPLKRGGGRRYYRPDDIALLRRISDLLYIQGYTIKGVQRLLREGGGRLADNIPPPNEAEREAAEAERARNAAPQIQLLIPELVRPELVRPELVKPELVKPELVKPELVKPELVKPEIAIPDFAAGPPWRPSEAERLRASLHHVLHELEALRALLP